MSQINLQSANSPEFHLRSHSGSVGFEFGGWKLFHSVVCQRRSGFAPNFRFAPNLYIWLHLAKLREHTFWSKHRQLAEIVFVCRKIRILVEFGPNCQYCSLPLFHLWILWPILVEFAHNFQFSTLYSPQTFHLWVTSSGGWSQVAFAACIVSFYILWSSQNNPLWNKLLNSTLFRHFVQTHQKVGNWYYDYFSNVWRTIIFVVSNHRHYKWKHRHRRNVTSHHSLSHFSLLITPITSLFQLL